MLKNKDIRIRDPFILPVSADQTYYLYGTTDDNVWEGKGTGFDVYQSTDLENWDGPFQAFRPDEDFWADHHFWAPEVHVYEGKYYMFATFKAENQCRGTQILVSNRPLGPFTPLTEEPVTPSDWECLDGTLFIDENKDPWMVFCHEWLQVKDGKICAIKLSKDLKTAISDPIVLFKASEASWTVSSRGGNYVTDGPFLYRNVQGELLMLWSSGGPRGYAIGISRSESGEITGPWTHDDELLFEKDGGHGMLFYTFEGQLMLSLHAPNHSPNERPVFYKIEEKNGTLTLLDNR
ncbi:glycoside hydrolase family 43 protein [Pseudogracilibacillus auburnensis]|uniref:glycoside hydrolase family 43 protein n=1 Tax=Pseudogracilibacillus auburnensis TaxID=1494959 RepID=UPI001A9688F8|nr:glycoside hydrolase family 43 protein [Pseudogracilibacillus auburnensis]MBO1005119.1 family 43 glycosylhydrolase [Pseudogracilibacillus auburnensis]